MIQFELIRQSIIFDHTMYHFHSFRFHGMFFTELVFDDIFIVKIANFPHFRLLYFITINKY